MVIEMDQTGPSGTDITGQNAMWPASQTRLMLIKLRNIRLTRVVDIIKALMTCGMLGHYHTYKRIHRRCRLPASLDARH